MDNLQSSNLTNSNNNDSTNNDSYNDPNNNPNLYFEDDSINYNSKISYENCWKAIIRPHRDIYDVSSLGAIHFSFKYQHKCIREDYNILTSRGLMIVASFFRFDLKSRKPFIRPCVIYLHGNSSSRLEGTRILRCLFEKGIDVFTFDFPGCGLSEGDYISLGYHEKKDVGDVIDFVAKLPGVGAIGLWGRSMGAATAALCCNIYKEKIKAICLDSPFEDLNKEIRELVYNLYGIPSFLVSGALFFIKRTIKSKVDMDIDDVCPINEVKKEGNVPAFFIHAMKDKLIPLQHTLNLYEAYTGQKVLNIVEGDHNSSRQRHVLKKVSNFFEEHLYGINKKENEKIEEINKSKSDNEKENKEENINTNSENNNNININIDNNGGEECEYKIGLDIANIDDNEENEEEEGMDNK